MTLPVDSHRLVQLAELVEIELREERRHLLSESVDVGCAAPVAISTNAFATTAQQEGVTQWGTPSPSASKQVHPASQSQLSLHSG